MGRDEPKRRRAHLYAVIQEMTAAEPHGFLKDDANVERLCALGQVSPPATIAISVRMRKSARMWFLIAGDKKYDPMVVISKCELFWEAIIGKSKIVEPPNPFSRSL